MMMGFKIFAHTFSQDVLGLRVVGIPKPALQLPHMGHESGIKPNRGLDLCLRGSTDLPFCLDDQNHNWTAKSNAVLFLYAYMDLYLDLLGDPYAFPHLMAILVLEMPPT